MSANTHPRTETDSQNVVIRHVANTLAAHRDTDLSLWAPDKPRHSDISYARTDIFHINWLRNNLSLPDLRQPAVTIVPGSDLSLFGWQAITEPSLGLEKTWRWRPRQSA